ncbi:MAG: hypothetical protein BWY88_01301 [Synergistetes bacterium ADurb.Bin520]|nr:MAG: hypothetical protein BWY88_01301 [Synergistetes bacterium ADurb.Bin520]
MTWGGWGRPAVPLAEGDVAPGARTSKMSSRRALVAWKIPDSPLGDWRSKPRMLVPEETDTMRAVITATLPILLTAPRMT